MILDKLLKSYLIQSDNKNHVKYGKTNLLKNKIISLNNIYESSWDGYFFITFYFNKKSNSEDSRRDKLSLNSSKYYIYK